MAWYRGRVESVSFFKLCIVSFFKTIFTFFRTENTGMIAGLGKAAELITNHVILYGDHMRSVRNYLESKLEVIRVGCVSIEE